MDRAAVANLPRWERSILEEAGIGMLNASTQAPAHAAYTLDESASAPVEISEYDLLTKSAEELGLA